MFRSTDHDYCRSECASAAVAAGAVVYSGRKKRRVELERVRRLNETAVRGSDTGKVSDKKSILRAEVLRERLAKQLERRSAELAEDEARVQSRRQGLERRFESIKERNDDLAERFSDLKEKRREVDELREEIERFEALFTETIEKQVGDTTQNALRELEIDITEEAQVAAQKAAKAYEATMVDRAEFEAKKLIDMACHRYQCALPANRWFPLSHCRKRRRWPSEYSAIIVQSCRPFSRNVMSSSSPKMIRHSTCRHRTPTPEKSVVWRTNG